MEDKQVYVRSLYVLDARHQFLLQSAAVASFRSRAIFLVDSRFMRCSWMNVLAGQARSLVYKYLPDEHCIVRDFK